jgi:D-alanyl-D-alanine carboxypeptidase/D-alanyl-D-alanine-endopeptidase (penicillin-binding protein 4)
MVGIERAGVRTFPALYSTRRGVRLAVAILVAAGWMVGSSAAAPQQSSPAGVVRSAEASGIRIAVCAVDVDRGAEVFGHRAGALQLPASNQKLVTVVAFLERLGADYEFRTGFRVRDGVLVVSAGGDPNWRSLDEGSPGRIDPVQEFGRIVRQLRGAGLRGLRGVELSDGRFVGPERPDDWPREQWARTYCAPTAGLVLDGGCWIAEVGPGESLAEVSVLSPPAGIDVDAPIAMTRDRKRGGKFHLELRDDGMHGRGHFLVGAGARVVDGAAPTARPWFERALRHALEVGGLPVEDGAERVDVDLEDVVSGLRDPLARALVSSSNFDAEMLARVLGAEVDGEGSFDGARRALRAVLDDVLPGGVPEGVQFGDGSGMSRRSRASARFFCDLLVHAARSRFADVFVGALPVAGEDGTLERRFAGSAVSGRVRAKTGSLNGVSTLSGYLRTKGGRLLAFSILTEWDRPVKGASPRAVQERLVEALDR